MSLQWYVSDDGQVLNNVMMEVGLEVLLGRCSVQCAVCSVQCAVYTQSSFNILIISGVQAAVLHGRQGGVASEWRGQAEEMLHWLLIAGGRPAGLQSLPPAAPQDRAGRATGTPAQAGPTCWHSKAFLSLTKLRNIFWSSWSTFYILVVI